MKEYMINASIVVEAEESDFERVSEYAQKLADNLIQDEEFAYDGDIKILEVNVDKIEDLNTYDSDNIQYDNDEDDYE